MPSSPRTFDVAVVGAGVCGLAHALAAARRGKRVVVVDRDRQANGASVRNFGFVRITGQQAGECWRRARRSREVWAEVAAAAGIPVLQRGLLVIARRPEARAVLEQFLAADMGAECRLVEPADLEAYGTGLRSQSFAGALYSPHEVRVESREAIPRLAAWLAERHDVTFRRETVVHAASPPRLIGLTPRRGSVWSNQFGVRRCPRSRGWGPMSCRPTQSAGLATHLFILGTSRTSLFLPARQNAARTGIQSPVTHSPPHLAGGKGEVDITAQGGQIVLETCRRRRCRQASERSWRRLGYG